MILVIIAISSYFQEKLKKMKSMLLILVCSIRGIGNFNYQRFEEISSDF